MNKPSYLFTTSKDALRFEFDSVSDSQIIRKLVIYTRYLDTSIFNLALGDITTDGHIDDKVRSNNADMDKVMATVVQTLFQFFDRYPECQVYFEGSTRARTRLYQIIISRELNEASQLFILQGIRNSSIEPFQVGQTYQAFLISLKK